MSSNTTFSCISGNDDNVNYIMESIGETPGCAQKVVRLYGWCRKPEYYISTCDKWFAWRRMKKVLRKLGKKREAEPLRGAESDVEFFDEKDKDDVSIFVKGEPKEHNTPPISWPHREGRRVAREVIRKWTYFPDL